jgi:hypothetical protein
LTEGLLHIPHEIVRIPNPRIKVKDFLVFRNTNIRGNMEKSVLEGREGEMKMVDMPGFCSLCLSWLKSLSAMGQVKN